MIKCENLSFKIQEHVICENLCFHIKRGESLCFSGESGKGKTSLLKMIMGILIPNSGKLAINGLELCSDNINKIRSQIAWLPQNVNLPVNSTNEFIHFLNFNKQNIETFDAYCEKLGLRKIGRLNKFNEISGGERQRILIAACLSMNKAILCFDEPTSALDNHSIDLLIKLLNDIRGLTILSSSHNAKWINYCNRNISL